MINNISVTTEYALRAMVELAHQVGEPRKTRDIAKATSVPLGYLAKVLQDLRWAGLVESRRGLNGGFTLSRPPAETTVREVVDAVRPMQRITTCPLGRAEHAAGKLCPLHRMLDRLIAETTRAFEKTTLEDLLIGRTPPLCGPRGMAADGSSKKAGPKKKKRKGKKRSRRPS